ncbi:MAG: thiamine pyrophosphate-binding protein [Pseudomonadota bacterium]
MAENGQTTVGGYLAARLHDIGIRDYFVVPGDYNLVLLDELLKNPGLRMISCCNELNAGYAADGYARATGGPAAAVVTFSVGGLSLLNGVAGSHAEDLPVIAISGGPNTNSTAEYELLHHTLGRVDYEYQREIFDRICVDAVIVQHPDEAPTQIDNAIKEALYWRKPVYIEIACNIANEPTSPPTPREFPRGRESDPTSLREAVAEAAELLNKADKPVLLAGVKLRPFGAIEAFAELADSCGYAVATMPNAKGFFPESRANYIGTYWGPVSSPSCSEIVESSDMVLAAGPTLTDYTTTGHSTLINRKKMISLEHHSVRLPGQTHNAVAMRDFLTELTGQLKPNDSSMVAFERIREPAHEQRPVADDAPLTTMALFSQVQRLLDGNAAVVAETGDSWFNGMNLKLPEGARFEIQMQYGSIGWSVGAVLGFAIGAGADHRVIGLIGDGSFQLTAQEISTMIRYDQNPIIFLINNGGYTIEVEIHDGPYNTIKNWNYAGLIEVFGNGEGKGLGLKAGTEGELAAAIAQAKDHDGLVMIEVAIDRDDCSRNLLRWGGHVAKNNGRPTRCR